METKTFLNIDDLRSNALSPKSNGHENAVLRCILHWIEANRWQ
jgi:hypothetical protein